MSKRTTNITSATTTEVAICNKPRNADLYLAKIYISGTFGGTTVTLLSSPDNGTTKVPLLDPFTGTAYSITADGQVNFESGAGSTNSDAERIYVTTTGGSGIDIDVAVFDNF